MKRDRNSAKRQLDDLFGKDGFGQSSTPARGRDPWASGRAQKARKEEARKAADEQKRLKAAAAARRKRETRKNDGGWFGGGGWF